MVNVAKNGTFYNIDENIIIETFGTIGKDGVKVQNSIQIPTLYRGMTLNKNAYEKLTVDNALTEANKVYFLALI